jgi:hypothetical protein
MTDPTSRQRGRPQKNDKTVTLKKKSLVKSPLFGLGTKTYWLTDRQSQCDFDLWFSGQSFGCRSRGRVLLLCPRGRGFWHPFSKTVGSRADLDSVMWKIVPPDGNRTTFGNSSESELCSYACLSRRLSPRAISRHTLQIQEPYEPF